MPWSQGWQPAVARAVFYGSLRLGLYKPLKSTFREAGVQSKMTSEIMAGCAVRERRACPECNCSHKGSDRLFARHWQTSDAWHWRGHRQ